MRFEELCLRIPGDELRMRFHERLTVLSGLSAIERQGLVDGVLGALTGVQARDTTISYVDATGRRVRVSRDGRGDLVHLYDDGSPATDLIAVLGLDPRSLHDVICVRPGDLGVLAPEFDAAEPPELAEARAALLTLAEAHESAMAGWQAVETMREELAAIDERLREADEGRAKRRYARLLADLERVRAEAAALRGGELGAEADRRFISSAGEAHRLSERWHRASRRVSEQLARWGDRQRLDERTMAEAAAVPDRVPSQLDALVHALEEAEERRSSLAARLSTLAASRLSEPSHPAVVRLARADQDHVWAAAKRALETKERLNDASLALGGLPAEGAQPGVAEQIEAAHAVVEDAEREVEARRGKSLLAAGAATAAGIVALPLLPVVAPLAVAGAAASAMWGIVRPKRQLAQALAKEEDTLERVGVASYLGFHIRRIDATIDPTAREKLDLAVLEHRVALGQWHEVAGDIDPGTALGLETEVRAYASALANLDGAADEIEAVRRELAHVAEPAAARAQAELLQACAPYGVDDANLAASMVRHQVVTGTTARLQRELEAAEREEAGLRAELDALLSQLGFAGGDVDERVGNLDRALTAAAEREAARATARSRDDVERDLVELEARARREHQPEWGTSIVPDDAPEPDPEELRQQRESISHSYEIAVRLLPDVELLADRRAAVERRVTVLEAALGDSPAAAALAQTEDIERYLLARLASVRNQGPPFEPLPLLLDDPFLRIRGERKLALLDLVERLSGKAQVVYLSEDPDVVFWARRRAAAGACTLLEPVPADA